MIGESPKRSRECGRGIALAVLVLFAAAAADRARGAEGSAAPAGASVTDVTEAWPAHGSAGPGAQRSKAAARRATRPKAAEFSHDRPAHRRACDSCHKFPSANWKEARKGGEPFPDVTQYPQHSSCIGCHRRQFFSNEKPSPSICSVCHQSAVPRAIALHPFPTLSESFDKSPKAASAGPSDFLVFFPHDKHLAVLGELRREPEEGRGLRFVRASFGAAPAPRAARAQEDAAKANEVCATCHQTYQPQGDSDDEFVTKPPKDLPEGAFWLKKGTFKTSPADHASCFTCHSADSGLSPAPADCASCHRQRPAGPPAPADFDSQLAARMGVTDRLTLARWRDRQSAAFRHEWFSHAELKCADCHKVEEMNTADPRTKRVPVLSCGGGGSGCHITEKDDDDGALNLAAAQKRADPSFTCTKCHAVLGAAPEPASHASALSAIRK